MNPTMKTAVTVLQEMMVKLGLTPEYECIAQSGPQHQAMFDYRCVACGVVVTASARSKKEAKQEVARLMLQQLSRRGLAVPPPYAAAPPYAAPAPAHPAHPAPHPLDPGPAAAPDARSYVALLKELCAEYRLASVQYELVGDTGPPHLRHFTVRARIGQHERVATSTTKKTARQLAAEALYSYLRENLARVTRDFNEEDALVRAHEKAMERYTDSEEQPRRPDLGQKISEYHLGLSARLDEEMRARARAALRRRERSPCGAVAAAAEALRLRVELAALGPLAVLQLAGCAPDLVFAAEDAPGAAEAALRYMRRALLPEEPPADPDDAVS
ncbi:double-stranded RNA-binding protein Staufen homolog isoform X4 [Helicoverpa armigera]|uniref:double-stranded RNA-binding protein Staufen homolog isoform X4 n=1 Tax=Helicoverpa armigera TaxID=29058 RepID=UPI003082C236